MKLFTPYIETYTENGQAMSRVIVALVRNNLGYGMFNLPLKHGKVYQNDVRALGEPQFYFNNNNYAVEKFDQLPSRDGEKLIECTGSDILHILIAGVFKYEKDYFRAMKQWRH